MVEIILDPSIRDWVVLPMVIIFGCSAMVRHYVTLLLKTEKMASVEQLRPMNTVKRAQLTRINSKFITPDAFAMRKVSHYFTASQKKDGMKGALREKVKSEAMNQMMNPNSMLEMMKGNMTFMVSNFVMMGLMSYFFGGFVLGACRNLCVLFHRTASDDAKAMQAQMGMGAGPNIGFDAPKVYKQERVSLRLHNHDWALEFAEKKLLGEPIPVKAKTATASSTVSSTTTTTEKRSSKYTKISKRK
ncbi:hypothetical protein BBJ28_00002922 [Nothophytophthora sp. Chile5]|nr:hypothetical protein BBJ28_00002922 [Nothophytophthora sp. Chile5]